MAIYVLKRVLHVIPVFLGTTLLIYFMVFSMPGDPVLALFGDKTPDPAILERLRQQYHLDQPFFVQYLFYLGNLVQGNFGTSFTGEPVSQILTRTFPVTVRLAVLAILIEGVLGILVGLFAGLRRGRGFDFVTLGVCLLLISLPVFVIGFVAQLVFGVQLGWARTTVSAGAPLQDLILPAFVLASISFAQVVRLTRASVIDTSRMDFVRTAYAKGLPRRRVVRVHILRNSLIPVITFLGTDFGILLVGATVTEGIFNVPGVGNALYQAILRGENATVVSFVTVMVLIYLVVNLLVDLVYGLLDPRIRLANEH